MLKFFTMRRNLRTISQLVIFFTDQTLDEVKKSANVKMASGGAQSARARDAFREKETLLRNQFRFNMASRILMDAYGPARPGFFTGFIEGKRYSKLLYQIDPLGIENVSPEQVMLLNYDSNNFAFLTAFHRRTSIKKERRKALSPTSLRYLKTRNRRRRARDEAAGDR